MRPLLVLVLLSGALAGCAGEPPTPEPTGLDLTAPAGAQLLELANGQAFFWAAVETPFDHVFALPAGATMVRLVANAGDEAPSVAMWNEDTGRRRCNQQTVTGFGETLTGTRTCSSLTALDPAGTQWHARVAGPTADVRIEFITQAPPGPVAALDLSLLSHATHDLQDTTGQFVPSWDGAELWVEVTLPQGNGPWPTIISASPYNGQLGRLPDGAPAMWTYWTQDYAKRGYAAVNVDVRGFGLSGGCVEIWGEDEQRDQAFIVDWVASQPWSDGHVGFYGQSYVGTTPVEAAVQAPDALDAIIAVAPVINSYEDWHYGGVPNGESTGSPQAYQIYTDDPRQHIPPETPTDLPTILQYSVKGLCDPTILPLANDPRAVYNDFYAERDFKARASNVNAAVLYTQGFEDANVKGAMIPGWFDALSGPKLGLFGHWLHQHPARMDAEVLFLAWMDQYVKGKDIGLERLPPVMVNVDEATTRYADAWPAVSGLQEFGLEGDSLVPIGAGTYQIDASPLGGTTHSATTTLEAAMSLVAPVLHVEGTLDGDNLFLYAALTAQLDGESRLLTYGLHNIAHGDDHTTYTSGLTQPQIAFDLHFRPTEHLLPAGTRLTLTIGTAGAPVGASTALTGPASLDINGEATVLRIPGAPLGAYEAMPVTGMP